MMVMPQTRSSPSRLQQNEMKGVDIHIPDQARGCQPDNDEVRILEQEHDPGGIYPAPEGLDLFLPAEANKLITATTMNRLWEQEHDHEGSRSRHGRLEPEDVSP